MNKIMYNKIKNIVYKILYVNKYKIIKYKIKELNIYHKV